MEVLLMMSIFDICYGILGLFGKMNIAEKFKGHEWTKDYIRGLAFSSILLGIPYLILYFAFRQYDPGYSKMILFIILSGMPALIFIIFHERKYNELLKKY
ncbi:MAG: hypothetical protein IIU57_00970 [Oscillospiraceae bacterium]|nr:hypothetical protein [Oscillospiraceae bacterium]